MDIPVSNLGFVIQRLSVPFPSKFRNQFSTAQSQLRHCTIILNRMIDKPHITFGITGINIDSGMSQPVGSKTRGKPLSSRISPPTQPNLARSPLALFIPKWQAINLGFAVGLSVIRQNNEIKRSTLNELLLSIKDINHGSHIALSNRQ